MYLKQLFDKQTTPQSRPIPGTDQGRNNAGGFAWSVSDWDRLDRFLLIGTEGGTYYVDQQTLTLDAVEAITRLLAEDGPQVVARTVEISEAGRAPGNDPALFVLALAAAHVDAATRKAALAALPRVARTGTHLFHFLAFVENFRGWGRGLRRAIGNWYNTMPAERLAYQAIKYQQRDGWTHRDALRLAHPEAATGRHDAIFRWITQGWEDGGPEPRSDTALAQIWAFEQAKRAESAAEVAALIRTYTLPWEAVPGAWQGSFEVWQALLPDLPMTALLRNLARLTAYGVIKPLEPATAEVIARLTDRTLLHRARVHPIAVLAAAMTYAAGRGTLGSLTWTPISAVDDALTDAFYAAFANVEPTGKRLVLALDVSGSMGARWHDARRKHGFFTATLTPRVAAAALALVTAAVEEEVTTVAFSHEMVPLTITRKMRLPHVVKQTDALPFGDTDCAQPMLWALRNGVEADAFVVYTDSETWYGDIHPAQALREYRRRTGIPAKLVVVGMASNGFTIADPDDAGMLDVVGFDTATPAVIADFLRQ